MDDGVVLSCKGICKDFGITKALVNVDFAVRRGRIHGLVGENGSGKSTLAAIISGIHKPTAGAMEFMGAAWSPKSSLDALNGGVGIIVQEAGTIPALTVAQNIFLGAENRFRKGVVIDRRAMNEAATRILRDIGHTKIEGGMTLRELSVSDRKIVEIARAYYSIPKIFIVDETTNALSLDNRELLFKLIHRIADEGESVLIISHNIEELMEHCDSITILKDGVLVATLEREQFEEKTIKSLMIGRELIGNYYRGDNDKYGDEIVMRADRITTLSQVTNVSLELHRGEILGIGGLSDCGMHFLGRALCGEEPLATGAVTVVKEGGNVKIDRIETAVKNGVAYLSYDRDGEMLADNASIHDNIAISGVDVNRALRVFISAAKERLYVKKQVDSLKVKCNSAWELITSLSGGNKQKVGFAKWLAKDPDIIIMDCPTRGIDIGVKQDVYRLMYNLKKEGKAIVLISEELTELIGMSDRLLVMKNGAISKEFMRGEQLTERSVIDYML